MGEYEGQPEAPQEEVVDPDDNTEEGKYDGGPIPPVESTEQEN